MSVALGLERPWWNPPPVVERFWAGPREFSVVRDDKVPGGSKARFLPRLIGQAEEVVFGGPFCGGAPYALSIWAKREGKKASLFYAKRSKLHFRQEAARRNGARLFFVPAGRINVVQARAREYAQKAGALFLPLGFDLPQAQEPFLEAMREVREASGPFDEVWAASGSGMLARCLGLAFPSSQVFGVAVGLGSRHGAQAFPPNVKLLESGYEFSEECEASAPFDSCPNYDLKAWKLCWNKAQGKRVLFWNVLGRATH
jgi:hypothetical protein